jgi:hypothetical protein
MFIPVTPHTLPSFPPLFQVIFSSLPWFTSKNPAFLRLTHIDGYCVDACFYENY